MAEKYKYTLKVRKIVYSQVEHVEVVAGSWKEAELLAIEKGREEVEWDTERIDYDVQPYSVSVKPVEE